MSTQCDHYDEALRERVGENLAAFEVHSHRGEGLRAAAVALTLVADDSGAACFVLTRRAARLRAHSGQWALPGGRIDPGETPLEAAIRETREEVGITPHFPVETGELFFQFCDGLSIHCVVFFAHSFSGELIETDEAVPLWTRVDEIPYDEMWEDDRHWLPLGLAGRHFRAPLAHRAARLSEGRGGRTVAHEDVAAALQSPSRRPTDTALSCVAPAADTR